MKILSVGAELFYAHRWTDRQTGREADGQTDMTKLVVTFHNFVDMPRKGQKHNKNYIYNTRMHQKTELSNSFT